MEKLLQLINADSNKKKSFWGCVQKILTRNKIITTMLFMPKEKWSRQTKITIKLVLYEAGLKSLWKDISIKPDDKCWLNRTKKKFSEDAFKNNLLIRNKIITKMLFMPKEKQSCQTKMIIKLVLYEADSRKLWKDISMPATDLNFGEV